MTCKMLLALMTPILSHRPTPSRRLHRTGLPHGVRLLRTHSESTSCPSTHKQEVWVVGDGVVRDATHKLARGVTQGLERQINCIAAHPSRPHLCATGASAGSVAVWDLRFTAQPTVHVSPKPGSGEVWEVSHHPFQTHLSASDPPCHKAFTATLVCVNYVHDSGSVDGWDFPVHGRDFDTRKAQKSGATTDSDTLMVVQRGRVINQIISNRTASFCNSADQVHFDGYEAFGGAAGGADPSVLFCTSGGVLGIVPSSFPSKASAADQLKPSAVLYEEPCSGIRSFDVDATSGQDLFCATDQECLVYLSRGARM